MTWGSTVSRCFRSVSALLVVVACSSTSENSVKCSAGDTRSCAGPGACSGAQICDSNGNWSTCDCGGSGGGGGVAGTAPTGGAGGSTGGAAGTAGTGLSDASPDADVEACAAQCAKTYPNQVKPFKTFLVTCAAPCCTPSTCDCAGSSDPDAACLGCLQTTDFTCLEPLCAATCKPLSQCLLACL